MDLAPMRSCAGLGAPRWQERFIREGLGALLRDKTGPPGRKPLDPAAVIEHRCGPDRGRSARRNTRWTSPSLLAGLLGRISLLDGNLQGNRAISRQVQPPGPPIPRDSAGSDPNSLSS